MTQLIPCPGCNRHVRQSENSCPFCSAALSLADVPEHALPRTRLGRAATFAFGATLVGAATLVACGGESEDGKKTGGGGSAGMASQAGTASGGSSAGTAPGGAVYGAPPFAGTGNGDGDGGTGNGAGMTSGGTSVGGSGGPGPVYGAPSAGFSGVPLYGAAPAD
jgi:hypothetical protein